MLTKMCRMISFLQCLLVAAAFREMLPAVGGGGEGTGSGEGSGILLQAVQNRETFSINLTDVIMPACATNQLLSYNGTEFLCIEIPERKCICPSPMVGTDEPPTLPPEPPGGCPVFEPPDGGGFVCLPNTTVIHCSVLCDNGHEFSSTPLNPYHCGQGTKFKWEDFTGTMHKDLPQCSGFRYTLRPLHRGEYYLPGPCPLVMQDQAQADTVKTRFCDVLTDFVDKDQINCTTSSAFIQCPKTPVTVPPVTVPPVTVPPVTVPPVTVPPVTVPPVTVPPVTVPPVTVPPVTVPPVTIPADDPNLNP